MPFSVAIADNHDVTRWGVRSVVESVGGQVVATAETGLDAVAMVEEQTPDYLILSLRLPHLNGFDVLFYLQQSTLAMKVLVLTTCEKEDRIKTVFERGALAYVLKQDPLEELSTALDAVRRGERYISSSLPESLIETVDSEGGTAGDMGPSLTMREREVVQLTAEGYTSQEVGIHLGISSRTVEKHRQNIKDKLEIGSVVEMAYYASQRGFLSDPRLLHSRRATAV